MYLVFSCFLIGIGKCVCVFSNTKAGSQVRAQRTACRETPGLDAHSRGMCHTQTKKRPSPREVSSSLDGISRGSKVDQTSGEEPDALQRLCKIAKPEFQETPK